MIHLFSWDPGATSGWCHLSIHQGEIGVFNCGETDHLGVGNMLYDNPSLKASVSKKEIETIFVVEKFVMNTKVTPQPWSLETTGLIRYFAERYQIPFELVSPSAHKNLITNEVIKRAGMWVPAKGHSMDAVRIGLWYLITKKGLLKECLISGKGENAPEEN